jgi:hypothetical protein
MRLIRTKSRSPLAQVQALVEGVPRRRRLRVASVDEGNV